MSHNFSLTSDALPHTHTHDHRRTTHSHTFISTVYTLPLPRAFLRSLAGLASRDRPTSARRYFPLDWAESRDYASTRVLSSLRHVLVLLVEGNSPRFFSTALYTLESERLARLSAAAASSKSAKSARRHLHSMHKLHSFITPRGAERGSEGKDDRPRPRRMLVRDRNKRAARPAACFRGVYISGGTVRSSSSALSLGRAAFFGIPEKIRGLEARVAQRERKASKIKCSSSSSSSGVGVGTRARKGGKREHRIEKIARMVEQQKRRAVILHCSAQRRRRRRRRAVKSAALRATRSVKVYSRRWCSSARGGPRIAVYIHEHLICFCPCDAHIGWAAHLYVLARAMRRFFKLKSPVIAGKRFVKLAIMHKRTRMCVHTLRMYNKCSRGTRQCTSSTIRSFEVNYIDDETGLTHLHVACEYGCDDVVEKFLNLGQNPNCFTPKILITPLYLALLNGHEKTAELLLRRGADPNVTTAAGATPLHVICRRDDDSDDLLKMFFKVTDDIQHKVQVDDQDKWGNRPLHLALLNNNQKVAESLLRRGVDLNSPNNKGSTPLDIIYKKNYDEDFIALFFKISDEIRKKVWVDVRDKLGNTLLHRALLDNDRKMVESLLRHGADSNDANSIGLSPVHLICLGDVVDDFLEFFFRINDEMQKMVRVDAQDVLGRTPLHLALEFNNKEAIKLLLKRGASPNIANEDGLTPLHLICNDCHDAHELAEIFFDTEVNQLVEVDARDKLGQTPLQVAVSRGHKNLARLLLTKGADPNIADDYGLTPWHSICSGEVDDDLVELFINGEIKQAMQLDARDKSGRSPLHYALLDNNKKAVEWLLRRGVDLNLADSRGLTPLHLISLEQVDDDIVEIFFKNNDMTKKMIEIDARDKLGNTPLHQALLADNKKVAVHLLKIGADPNLVDYKDSTPLHLICKRKYDDDLAEIFFEINDQKLQSIELDARDERYRTPLQLAVLNGLQKVAELLLRRGADSDLTSEGGKTPLHLVCTSDDDDDLTKILFKINDDIEQQVDARDRRGNAPLHLALGRGKDKKAESLLRRGADPCSADETGRTALHLISQWDEDRDAQLFVHITEHLRREGQIDARDRWGNTALHVALSNGINQKAAFLLMRGADPNAANADGFTPLHFIVAQYSLVEDYMVDELFKIAQDLNETVQIDAQDKMGNSPLHLALCNGDKKKAESLLRLGANPDLPNAKGLTPLHVICMRKYDDDLMEMFFKINDSIQQSVKIDAVDNLGQTPLRLAVSRGLKKVTESLLKHGANANLANARGETPMHIICKSDRFDNLAEMFLKACKEAKQPVELDARDSLGRTPLQWAVASLLPNTVNVLLDHGADLSNFVFPTEDHFAKHVPWYSEIQDFKLMYASALLAAVEHLEKRGHELDRSDALTIIKLFAEHGLFESSADLRKCWYFYEDLAMTAKKIIVHSSLSLYDLTRIRSEEVEQLFLYENYRDLVNEEYSHYYWSSFEGSIQARAADLCEKLSKGFFINKINGDNVVDQWGNTPLHMALSSKVNLIKAESLLRGGADPNAANAYGFTPLHLICQVNLGDGQFVEKFFKITEDLKKKVQVDVLDKHGNTPLHLALSIGKKKEAEWLLRKGANPDLANAEGLTPLHIICKRKDDGILKSEILKMFFKVNADLQQEVNVNAKDKCGRTALQLALARCHWDAGNLLLKAKADPNLTNEDRSTPLHIICKNDRDDWGAVLFLKTCQDLKLKVEMNVRDKSGRTPLQWAVASLLPKNVQALLENGANLSDFEFPHDYFGDYIPKYFGGDRMISHVKGALFVFFHLRQWQYQITRQDALTLVTFFSKNKLLMDQGYGENWFRHNYLWNEFKIIVSHLRPDETQDILERMEKLRPKSNHCRHRHHRIGVSVRFHAVVLDRKDDPKMNCSSSFSFLSRGRISAAFREKKRNRNEYFYLTFLLKETREYSVIFPKSSIFFSGNINFSVGGDAEYFQREDIIDFVALTGYRDEPDVDEDGKPVLRRTTPVHQAAQRDYLHVVKSLFKIYDRFDVNYIDEESGLTHFHVACMSHCNEVVEKFLELGQDPNLRVPRTGDSSMHLVSAQYNVEVIALLLEHGADPNLANEEGLTPLHVICRRSFDDHLVDLFFKMNDDAQRTIQVDARDKVGRTALHWAVANHKPHVADVLLDHEADLSSFVFPTASYFARKLVSGYNEGRYNYRLELAASLLDVTERIVKRGYELCRSDVQMIMETFARHKVFKKPSNLETRWYDHEEFEDARYIFMNSSLSLYDLIQLRPEEAARRVTYSDYFKFADWHLQDFPRRSSRACSAHLCEIMSRGFYQRWALDPFWELIRYRLPLECCEQILEKLTNED
ncbi:unnamed protein product, partial [Trichogramma brassicae]